MSKMAEGNLMEDILGGGLVERKPVVNWHTALVYYGCNSFARFEDIPVDRLPEIAITVPEMLGCWG